jgi:uncharacterized protein (TIGR02284 family)
MASMNNEAISTLNNLIETCLDGKNGFNSAADGAQNAEYKRLFEQYAQQRAQYVGELQGEVRRLGGDPQNTGSVAGALHRGWIDIKSAVTGKDDHAILEEAERGEDSAMRNYQDALGQPLPPETQTLVRRQYQAIQEAHNRVRSLRDRTQTARA